MIAASPLQGLLSADIGASDCERHPLGDLAQPVNALTSAAYCVVGVVVILLAVRWSRWRARTIIYGLCLVATGIGSVLFHGPQPSGARFLHDFPIVLVILLIALHDLSLITPRFRRVPLLFAVVGSIGTVAALVWPDIASAATGVLAVIAVVAEVIVYRRRLRGSETARQQRLLAVIAGVAGIAASSWLLGRTDSPACDPDSYFQFHGLWHVMSAVAFGLWWWLALAESPSPSGPASPDATTPPG